MIGIPPEHVEFLDKAVRSQRIWLETYYPDKFPPSNPENIGIMSDETTNPKVIQVDGSHYKGLAIDPFEYCHRNGIGLIAGSAIKHITRYKQKAGKTDLLKAISEIQRLIEIEYPEK